MISELEQKQDRREFLRTIGRYAATAAVGTASAFLLIRKARNNEKAHRCTNRGICDGCSTFDGCSLPQALSAKQATSK
jgi:hypothetical protein